MSLSLAACSHTEDLDDSSLSKDDVAETIDLTTGHNLEKMREIVEGRQDIMNLPSLSNTISEGRVEVYDIAQDDIAGSTIPAMDARSDHGMRVSDAVQVNDSVLIYSLDDERPVMPAPVSIENAGVVTPVQRQPALEAREEFVSIAMPGAEEEKIYFSYNSSLINPDSFGALDRLAEAAKGFSDHGVSIEGHASKRSGVDNVTRRQMGNLKISVARAYNVAKELVKRGVPAKAIRVVGWGEMMADRVGGDTQEAQRVDVMPIIH